MSFFLGGQRSAGFFTDSVFGRGKLCPFYWEGSGALVSPHLGGENCVLFSGRAAERWFLHGFSVWEGKTVSFFLGGQQSAGFFTDSVFGRGKLCPFFWEGSGALVSSRIQCLGGENCVLFSGRAAERWFLHRFSVWEGKTVSFFLGGQRSAGFFTDSVFGREKLCPFFWEGSGALVSSRIQCLGGENCVLFSGRAAERWFLHGFSVWGGEIVSFFLGGQRSAGFFTDSVFGRGKLCPFFWEGSGALVSSRIQCLGGKNCVLFSGRAAERWFLHGFSVREGKTVGRRQSVTSRLSLSRCPCHWLS